MYKSYTQTGSKNLSKKQVGPAWIVQTFVYATQPLFTIVKRILVFISNLLDFHFTFLIFDFIIVCLAFLDVYLVACTLWSSPCNVVPWVTGNKVIDKNVNANIPVSLSFCLSWPSFASLPQLNSLIQVFSGLIQFSAKARLPSFAVLPLNHKTANKGSLAFAEN